MKLYIAEKPSLGRAIATAISSSLTGTAKQKNHKTHIELANGDVVSWCIGHILAQADPQDYDESLKKWSMETLPIIPQHWQLKPITRTRAQLTVLRKLVKQADDIIHAGDPDREGQLLVDEVIDFLKVSKTKKNNVKRLLISDLNLPAVQRALKSLKNNSEFMPLSISALARSRADWLYGINLTRAYTLQGQKQGFNSVLSVGRVQTPLLGLVVRREQDINAFVTKPFYQVLAHITLSKSLNESLNNKANNTVNGTENNTANGTVSNTVSGSVNGTVNSTENNTISNRHQDLDKDSNNSFSVKWQPSDACRQYCDDEGRVLVKSLAQNVVTRITGQAAIVERITNEEKQQSQPLPFNLSSLQIAAAKQFSMNAKLVLDVCQSLYEKHKLITYPRSDCRYLPKEHFKQATTIITKLAQSNLPCNEQAKNADSSIKSKVWNDKKITAHHAIIPTEKVPTGKTLNSLNLNSFEKNIYLLIVRQYLLQFYPIHLYQQTKLTLSIAGGVFTCNAKTPVQQGWKILFPQSDKEPQQKLPKLAKGDVLHCEQGELVEKQTSPPESFTDATLLGAMTGIARFVSDNKIKKVLKDTDGLGTDATRAGIIDLLFKRNFLLRQGKKIIATDVGIALVKALPEAATLPDMTAQWEATLTAISEKKASYLSFMQPLSNIVTAMVHGSAQQSFKGLPKVAFIPKKGKRKYKKTA